MGRSLARIGIVVGIVGCLCSCLGQASAPDAPQRSFPDSAAYSTFLSQVARLARASGAVLLNGEPMALRQPTAQDEIGLTDREARLLNELATEYSAEDLAMSLAEKRLRWERLMRTTASEEVPASLSEQLESLNNRRSSMVLEYVRRLEAMFGDARFRALNDWVLSKAEADGFRAGNGVTSSLLLSKVEPAYTPEARAAKIEGVVLLRIEIDTDGVPQNIRVLRGLDPGLDQNAIDAVYKWRFRPVTKDGRPVIVEAQVEVNFRLL